MQLEVFAQTLQNFHDDSNNRSFWEYILQNQDSITPQIDAFFTEAFSVQKSLIIARHRQNAIPKRVTSFASKIYSLYSKISSRLNHTNSPLSTKQFNDLSGESGLLHLTRLMPFCQIFVAVDDQIGLLLVNGISNHFPNAFQSMMEELNSGFIEV